jgi:hypothetical protein
LENYLLVAEELVAMDPENPTFQTELGYAHSSLGFIDEAQGSLTKALEHYLISLEIRKAQLDATPGSTGVQYDLARAHNKIGLIQHKLGFVNEARNEFRIEMEIREKLLAAEPDDMKQRDRLATTYWFRASVEAAAGSYQRAADFLEAEVAIYRELASRDPENADWQRHLGVAYQGLAEIRHALHEARVRDELLRASRKLLEGVIARDPDRPGWQRDIARVETVESIAALDRGQPTMAVRRADEAIDRLARFPTGDVSGVVALGEARLARAAALSALRRESEAEAELSIVVALLDPSHAEAEARLVDVVTRAALHLGQTERAASMYHRLRQRGYGSPGLRALCARIPCA